MAINTSNILYIGSDHAGFPAKQEIIKYLEKKGYKPEDVGTYNTHSVDYPDYAHQVAQHVNTGSNRGILICGSGNGMVMTANKYQNVRAALAWNEEIVSMARKHNNTNLLCLPARFVDLSTILLMVSIFLNTDFEGGRHQKRIKKMPISKIKNN